MKRQSFYIPVILKLKDTMWYEFDEQKSIGTQAFRGVYLWLNEKKWTWWESYLNTWISYDTQIAGVVWPQWASLRISLRRLGWV